MNSLIIEGCDGTGKTTIATILAELYHMDICHCTAEDPADYDFYRNTARKKNVIWDRHTVGELIYPKVFKREAQIGPEDARLALAYGRENGTKAVILTADLKVIEDRLEHRGNECFEVWDNLEFIHNEFLQYADFLNIPVVDTSGSILDALDKIIKIIESDDQFEFVHK